MHPMANKLIKFAKEEFYDVPEDWTDEQISNKLWWLRSYPYGPMIWCHYDEQLFDNPYINENYVEKPIPKGYKRIRNADQQKRYTQNWWFRDWKTPEECITENVACLGYKGPSFIWCWGDEELFKE